MMIYIHIPFCIKKCSYCDFCSGVYPEEIRELYVKRLISEIRQWAGEYKGRSITSVYFGGGTPTVLAPSVIGDILQAVRENYDLAEDCEISIESNPGTVDIVKLRSLKDAGFNRLSIGLQSIYDKTLKFLGRIHTFSEFEDAYKTARQAGFLNINVDLITAIPSDTREEELEGIKRITELTPPPEHISVYSLILEEGTELYNRFYGKDTGFSEDEERLLYWDTERLLKESDYEHYEISNYSLNGRQCIHNIGYWTMEEYLGFGLSAAGYVRIGSKKYRTYNTSDMDEYLHSESYKKMTEESESDEIEEFVFLGLRLTKGIDLLDFKERFHRDFEDFYKEPLERNIKNGLMTRKDNMIRLTEKGVDISNSVLADFILD